MKLPHGFPSWLWSSRFNVRELFNGDDTSRVVMLKGVMVALATQDTPVETERLDAALMACWRELTALVRSVPPGALGAAALVDYELASLGERITSARRASEPAAIKACLTECLRLLSQYKATLALP